MKLLKCSFTRIFFYSEIAPVVLFLAKMQDLLISFLLSPKDKFLSSFVSLREFPIETILFYRKKLLLLSLNYKFYFPPSARV